MRLCTALSTWFVIAGTKSASHSDSYTITANKVLQIFWMKICLNVLHFKHLKERFLLLVYSQTRRLLNAHWCLWTLLQEGHSEITDTCFWIAFFHSLRQIKLHQTLSQRKPGITPQAAPFSHTSKKNLGNTIQAVLLVQMGGGEAVLADVM